jgi:hypothetical protein
MPDNGRNAEANEMVNISITTHEVIVMSRSKSNADGWDEIFDDLILGTEPPTRYIMDAMIITKSGAKFKVSPDDFADIVAREKMLDPDQSYIHSCSITIDFTRIKRDVNRWTNKFIEAIETEVAEATIANAVKKRRPSVRKRKID